jgi:hypothetical protein
MISVKIVVTINSVNGIAAPTITRASSCQQCRCMGDRSRMGGGAGLSPLNAPGEPDIDVVARSSGVNVGAIDPS